jgi:hypothetical protein
MDSEKEEHALCKAANNKKESLPQVDPVHAFTFMEGLPDDISEKFIWPRLWIYAPKDKVTGRSGT